MSSSYTTTTSSASTAGVVYEQLSIKETVHVKTLGDRYIYKVQKIQRGMIEGYRTILEIKHKDGSNKIISTEIFYSGPSLSKAILILRKKYKREKLYLSIAISLYILVLIAIFINILL